LYAENSKCVLSKQPAVCVQETSLRFASRLRKVELGPAKKQGSKGGGGVDAAAKAKYEGVIGAKEQQVLQLQQELTAVKTRLKMVEGGKASGGGKRPTASGQVKQRPGGGSLPPAMKQPGGVQQGIGARIPSSRPPGHGPGEMSLEQFMSGAVGGGAMGGPPRTPGSGGPKGRRIVR